MQYKTMQISNSKAYFIIAKRNQISQGVILVGMTTLPKKGRKKVFPTGATVNPLQRMLGAYLRLERTKLGFSSNYVARRLGLNDTYLRLAESGRAALNQSLVFKIIEVFADSTSQTHDTAWSRMRRQKPFRRPLSYCFIWRTSR